MVVVLVGLSVIAGVGYGVYGYLELKQQIKSLEASAALLGDTIQSLRDHIARYKENVALLEKQKSDLAAALAAEQNKTSVFEAQINEISGTVGTLEKLSKLDPELLEKYSKVYFLSENYAPANLSPINAEFLYDKNKPQLILSGVRPFLEAMLESAKRDGIDLKVVSTYRSFYEQTSIKYGYKSTYGSGANQFSADQGYSEHQLGTTADFTTPEIKPEINSAFVKFEESKAYRWLTDNAYKFGFVLSYPKNNLYYQFEPWHWRFVGKELAGKLRDASMYFYEMSQRDIDQYLVKIFD